MFSKKVKIVEVGPRDGLQNEQVVLPLATKVDFINRLTETGLSVIECGSFVSPKWVPQMAESGEVFLHINKNPHTRYAALVPNLQGLESALKVPVDEVAVFAAASESFSQKNINCTIDESFIRFEPVLALAKEHNLPVRGYISCVMGCPYEGEVDVAQVIKVATKLYAMGCYEISLGDTIGVATPFQVKNILKQILQEIPIDSLAVHFHDTFGQAIVNIYAALEMGINIVDSSVSGLGGCPYAHGASGNVATEDVIYLLEGLGVDTGVDLNKLVSVSHFIAHFLGKKPGSKVAQAL